MKTGRKAGVSDSLQQRGRVFLRLRLQLFINSMFTLQGFFLTKIINYALYQSRREAEDMTIKEFAKGQGITTQAVYQRIKAAGIDLAGIKKSNSAELTAEGLETLRNIFAKNESSNGAKIAEYKATIASLQTQVEKLKEEKAAAREELEAAKQSAESWREQAAQQAEAVKAAQAIAAKLQEALEREQQTAQQAQALNMASIQALKASPRLSWWQRLTGKREKIPAEAVQAAEADKEE